MEKKNRKVVWQESSISRKARESGKGHSGALIWLTGLPCSGKSTIGNALEERLHAIGHHTYILDGDNIRHGLCSDLGFSSEDRMENIRRVGEVAALFVDAGIIVITAFISPFRSDRLRARKLLQEGDFFEVFINAPLAVCEQRDTKGMYKLAKEGKISDFSGISSPYEPPVNPELEINTDRHELKESVDMIITMLAEHSVISSAGISNTQNGLSENR